MNPVFSHPTHFRVSVPTQLTLFGHPDEGLRLPRVLMGTDLRLTIDGDEVSEQGFQVDDVDPARSFHFRLDAVDGMGGVEMPVRVARGLLRKGYGAARGYRFSVREPGLALSGLNARPSRWVGWVHAFLAAGDPSSGEPETSITRLAYDLASTQDAGTEVLADYLGLESGGLLFDDGHSSGRLEALPHALRGFVAGWSEEPTDQAERLRERRTILVDALGQIRERTPDFDWADASTDAIYGCLHGLADAHAQQVLGTVVVRDLCCEAVRLLRNPTFEPHELGRLLDEQHASLRDYSGLGTAKMESLIAAARKAGALGCSLHGTSGGFIAYAPHRPDRVAGAIDRAGGCGIVVNVGTGLKFEPSGVPGCDRVRRSSAEP